MSSTPSPFTSPVPQEPTKNSGLAIASLVLGLLSFVACCVTGLPALILGIISLAQINKSGGKLRGSGMAITGIVLGAITCLLLMPGLLLPAINNARESGRRTVSMNNMRNISIGLTKAENKEQHFPDRVIRSPEGKPLLSWRVHILPDLGQDALYKKFHLNEPWDSSHNKMLIDQMPEMYASPNIPSKSETPYQVPYGLGTIFDGPTSKSAAQIARGDGLPKTILLVEADQPVTWTKPDDWEFQPANPMQGLGSLRPGGFVAMFADGHVEFVYDDFGQKQISSLFTVNGHDNAAF